MRAAQKAGLVLALKAVSRALFFLFMFQIPLVGSMTGLRSSSLYLLSDDNIRNTAQQGQAELPTP